jgi:hypothetical protein
MSHTAWARCRRDMFKTFVGLVSMVLLGACGPAPEEDSCSSGERACHLLVAADAGNGGGAAESGCSGPAPELNCLYETTPICMNDRWTCPPTPLVLAFDGEPVRFAAGPARFDLIGSGERVSSDWPTAKTPWLALDRNRNGAIDDATELFGSAVRLADGRLAVNGFEALAELDDNHDRRIDARDSRFRELAVWADRDGDRKTGLDELTRATSLVSISLDYRVAPVCDDRGNCGIERAVFTWADANGRLNRGEVVDVHLPVRPDRLAAR